jgi:hypothetical protein
MQVRAGVDADGKIVAWDWRSFGHCGFNGSGGSVAVPNYYGDRTKPRRDHKDLSPTPTRRGRCARPATRRAGSAPSCSSTNSPARPASIRSSSGCATTSEAIRQDQWRLALRSSAGPKARAARTSPAAARSGVGLASARWGNLGNAGRPAARHHLPHPPGRHRRDAQRCAGHRRRPEDGDGDAHRRGTRHRARSSKHATSRPHQRPVGPGVGRQHGDAEPRPRGAPRGLPRQATTASNWSRKHLGVPVADVVCKPAARSGPAPAAAVGRGLQADRPQPDRSARPALRQLRPASRSSGVSAAASSPRSRSTPGPASCT